MARVARVERPGREMLGDGIESFLERLGGPAWIRIPGRDRSRARVVVTLLHGNEPSGVRAIWAWLHSGTVPAVDVGIFIGSVGAALAPPGFRHRSQPGDPDLNRVFLSPYGGEVGEVASEALGLIRELDSEALVDLHNTTGRTPPYAVSTVDDAPRRRLAGLFVRDFIHLDLRLGTLLDATRDDLPGVVIECGLARDPVADVVALRGLERFLEAERLDAPADPPPKLRAYDAAVQVRLRAGARVAYGDAPVAGAEVTLSRELDRHNFEPKEPGAVLGWIDAAREWPLEAHDVDGLDRSREIFRVESGRLELVYPRVPIMVTTDPAIARSDCLFYLVRSIR